VDVLVTEGKVELAALSIAPDPAPILPGVTSPAEQKSTTTPNLYLALPVERLGRLEAGEGATMVVSQKSGTDSGSEHPALKLKVMDEQHRSRRDTWRQGFVLFTGDTLEEVVAEIARYSPVAIEIVDPALKKIRIGGQFKVGDLNGMFEALEFGFGLHVTMVDSKHVKITASKDNSNKDSSKN